MDVSLTHPTAAAPRTKGTVQYSKRQILGVWAAAALPMAALAWLVAPLLARAFGGEGDLTKALVLTLTIGMVWQCALVALMVFRERGSLRWAVLKDALWLHRPRSPATGRVGGRLWLVLVPCLVIFVAEEFVNVIPPAAGRNMGVFLESDAGARFFEGNWLWFGIVVLLTVFNTVLGEELLFRGLLLPRMNGAFGRGDWVVNGVLFATYHLHMPWVIPAALLDTFALSYPSKRYRSAWIGIIVHSAQSVVILVGALVLVLG